MAEAKKRSKRGREPGVTRSRMQPIVMQAIPRHPDRVSTTDVVKALQSAGFATVTPRAVQKMLIDLAGAESNLVCIGRKLAPTDIEKRPYQWQWRDGATLDRVAAMNVHAALAFKLAYGQLEKVLPTDTARHLKAQQRRAGEVLGKQSELASWERKVRVVSRGLPVSGPAVDREVLHAVHDALLAGRCLEVTYRRRGRSDDEHFSVSPLALVLRDPLVTLICTLVGKSGLRQLHLHRMASARIVEGEIVVPAGFDVDRHLRDGHLGFRFADGMISLRLRVESDAVPTYEELSIAPDQTLVRNPDGSATLSATVPDTLELRGWIQGYGSKFEVLEPPSLRRAIASELRAAAARYGESPDVEEVRRKPLK